MIAENLTCTNGLRRFVRCDYTMPKYELTFITDDDTVAVSHYLSIGQGYLVWDGPLLIDFSDSQEEAFESLLAWLEREHPELDAAFGDLMIRPLPSARDLEQFKADYEAFKADYQEALEEYAATLTQFLKDTGHV